MPVVNILYGGQSQDSEGKSKQLPAKTALALKGPVLQVRIGLTQAVVEELKQRGEDAPEMVTGLALIDTGATKTCVDLGALKQIQAPVINKATIHSGRAPAPCDIYPVAFQFVGLSINERPVGVEAPQAAGVDLSKLELAAIIGRDVLQHFMLVYNGPAGQLTISL